MAVNRQPGTDVKSRYALHLEIGFAFSLSVVIAMFTIPYRVSPGLGFPTGDRLQVELERVAPPREDVPAVALPPIPPPQAISDRMPTRNEIVAAIETSAEDTTMDSPPEGGRIPPPESEPLPEIFEVVEKYPVLIGGLESLQSRLHYPEDTSREGVEGVVFLQFVVDEEGAVSDIVVLQTPGESLAREAIRDLRESRWEPGLQRGRPVKVRFTIPVRFRLVARDST